MGENAKNALSRGVSLEGSERVYTIEEVLGAGGFGITYKVSATVEVGNIEIDSTFTVKEHFLSEACERDVATSRVKCSAPVRDRVANSLTDFVAEARRLQSIKHPNIVKVSEVFEANNTAYYVMEYIKGSSLRRYIDKNGVLSESQALTVITPILNAINYLHQNRMTHLDIKPDNIMLKPGRDGELTPVLIDFGLSKHYDESGKATSTIRTLGCSDGYAPPEQYAGILTFTPQADVYALGATMFYLLTGIQPEKSTEIDDDYVAKSLPTTISEGTRYAIIHAMSPLRKSRTQSVADFARDLGIEFDDVTPLPASSESLTQQIGKPKPGKKDNSTEIVDPDKSKPSSRKWLMPTLIALGVIAVGVIVWLAVGTFNGSDIDSSSSVVDTAQVQEVDSVLVSEAAVVAPVPAVEVVDEDVDDGYSAAYAEALNMYNSGKYGECKSRCQALLRQYSAAGQRRQLNQLIDYCDTAIEREEAAELERQYKSDYASAEGLYNQRKYSECKSKCRTMLNSYPTHRDEINSLIGKCDSAISAAEQAAAASRLPDKAVDLGLSVLWCDRNVGAGSSSGYGNYYTFDEASSAAKSMGSGWRLPTKAELEELDNKCTWSWIGSGCRVTGPNGNSIYLPAAGTRNGSSTNHVGSYGLYWSSTPYYSDTAYYLNLGSGHHYVDWNYRSYGYSVRPVRAK